jgi:hypothetical protein
MWGLQPGQHQPADDPGAGAYDDGSGPDVGVTSIGQVEVFCFFRFETGIPISVSVTSPTGTVKRLEGCAPCESNPPWYALPGDPLGTYQVTAVQGSLKATGRFTLRPAEDRTLILPDTWLHREGVRRGTTIRIGVASFQPYEAVRLLFYYEHAGRRRCRPAMRAARAGSRAAAWRYASHARWASPSCS